MLHDDGTLGHIIGIVEEDEWLYYDVRWLTPRNEPSCCVSLCLPSSLRRVPDHVIPMPKSEAWYREARAFHEAIAAALRDLQE